MNTLFIRLISLRRYSEEKVMALSPDLESPVEEKGSRRSVSYLELLPSLTHREGLGWWVI